MKLVLFFCLLFHLNTYSQRLNFNYSYSMFNESTGQDLITTSDGHYLFAGATFYHNGPQQATLYKLDMNGNVVWSQLSPEERGEIYPGWVVETSSNLYLTAENFCCGVGGLIKMYDSSGNVLWTKQDNRNDCIFISAVEMRNNIYCFGSYKDTANETINFIFKTNGAGDSLMYVEGLNYNLGYYKTSYCVTNNNIAFCSGFYDTVTFNYVPTITLIDTNAVELWTKVYNTGNNEYGKSLIINNSGDFYFNTYHNYGLYKTDSNGNLIWRKDLPCFYQNEIVNWNNNDLIFASPYCIAKFDSSGTMINSFQISVSGYFSAIAITDTTIAFVGTDYQGGSIIIQDSYVMQFSDTSFILNILNDEENNFTIYPVPFQSYLNIQSNSHSENRIRIFDINGKVVFNRILQGSLQIDTRSWENGVYFVEIENDKHTINRKKILKMDFK